MALARSGARHDRNYASPGPRLRPRWLAGIPLPARPEDPRDPARLPRGHHRRAADHRLVRPRLRMEPGHRHRRPGTRRPGRRPARPRRERLRRVRQAPARRPAGRCRRLRTDPSRRDARLLHRLRPAQRPPAQPPPGLPVGRRVHPGPALPRQRQALPAHREARRPQAASTGLRSPSSWSRSGSRNARNRARLPAATWPT